VHLHQCKSTLEELDMQSCNITDEALASIKLFTSLRKLDIGIIEEQWDGFITDAGISHLQGLTTLQELHIGSLKNITDAGLYHLRGLTSLQKLDLFGVNDITDDGLGHLRNLSALQYLRLDWNDNISDDGLVHLHELNDLRELHMYQCDGPLTTRGLASLLDRCTRLKKLSVPMCYKGNDELKKQLEQIGIEVSACFHGR